MFFDRPESGELAVLVQLNVSHGQEPEDPREFEELVLSAGGDPVALITGNSRSPNARFFIGTGKLQELQQVVADHEAKLVILTSRFIPGHTYSPVLLIKIRSIFRPTANPVGADDQVSGF